MNKPLVTFSDLKAGKNHPLKAPRTVLGIKAQSKTLGNRHNEIRINFPNKG